MRRITCRGSNYPTKVRLLFFSYARFSSEASPPRSPPSSRASLRVRPAGELALGEIAGKTLKRAAPGCGRYHAVLNADKEELVAFADEDSGSCWAVEEDYFFFFFFFQSGAISPDFKTMRRAWPPSESLPGWACGAATVPDPFQTAWHRRRFIFSFCFLGMKWLIFKSWIFSSYKSDNQMPNISSRWWVCQGTINWKEQISPEKEEKGCYALENTARGCLVQCSLFELALFLT